MRDIEYRAYIKSDKEIKTVDRLNLNSQSVECDGVLYDYSEVELMHYTGLNDKNGNKIFEGDILKHVRGYSDYEYKSFIDDDSGDWDCTITIIGKIVFYPSKGFMIVGEKSSKSDNTGEDFFSGQKYMGLPARMKEFGEIIGNIHTTPELLEEA